jgi:predicted metal-dependent hydrolase
MTLSGGHFNEVITMTTTVPTMQYLGALPPIERRDLHFKFHSNAIWHPLGAHVSHLFNALSITFPAGEQFFVDSVRHYYQRILEEHPEMKDTVRGFIGQEAMHSREHEVYNKMLADEGYPIARMEQIVRAILEVSRCFPASNQLGVTAALEHFTAMLADMLLSDPEVLKDVDPEVAALWRWHAIEETEHKAVAYDVFQLVVPGKLRRYLLRVWTMLTSTFLLLITTTAFHLVLLKKDRALTDWRGWWRFIKATWITPGVLRRTIWPYLQYFRPGFHPWQHDNRHHVEHWKQVYGAAGKQ